LLLFIFPCLCVRHQTLTSLFIQSSLYPQPCYLPCTTTGAAVTFVPDVDFAGSVSFDFGVTDGV
jgi:hypothetical protein